MAQNTSAVATILTQLKAYLDERFTDDPLSAPIEAAVPVQVPIFIGAMEGAALAALLPPMIVIHPERGEAGINPQTWKLHLTCKVVVPLGSDLASICWLYDTHEALLLALYKADADSNNKLIRGVEVGDFSPTTFEVKSERGVTVDQWYALSQDVVLSYNLKLRR